MSASKEKIGLIGVGYMGTAIIEGLLKKKASPKNIHIYDKVTDKASAFASKHNLHIEYSVRDLIKKSDAVILAVKPQDLEELSPDLDFSQQREHLSNFKCIISILAGTPISKISKKIKGRYFTVVRAMPNLNAKVGCSVTAIASTNPGGLRVAEYIFSGCGTTIALEEEYFDLVTAISGSGPAYFFLMMELLIKKACEKGLSVKEAQSLAIQTALGSAILASGAKETPEELRKMVTSKKGTTEAALDVLFERKFDEIFLDAVNAAYNRGRELSKG